MLDIPKLEADIAAKQVARVKNIRKWASLHRTAMSRFAPRPLAAGSAERNTAGMRRIAWQTRDRG